MGEREPDQNIVKIFLLFYFYNIKYLLILKTKKSILL